MASLPVSLVIMLMTLQWYGHSHAHTTVGMARCVQAAVVVGLVQALKLLWFTTLEHLRVFTMKGGVRCV